ncbi:hypothetical protein ABW19_dt0201311 [Dactylella cylindrospora]|nr:hypothetical protein ABW19_dt0201311 [Dactylella cylindrospora]
MNSSLPIAGITPAGVTDAILEAVSSLQFTTRDLALYGLLALILPCVYTYIVTTLNDGKPTKDGEPPVPPYFIPFVGNGLALMRGQRQMVEKYRKEDGRPGVPRTLIAFGQKIYLITDPSSISLMWRKSKTMAFAPLQTYTYTQLFGGHTKAARRLEVGLIGVDQKGIEDGFPLMKHVHEAYAKELSAGTMGLAHMSKMFMKELNKELEFRTSEEFMEVSLYAFVKKIIFPSSARALFGYKLRVTDEFADNFWRWDDAFLELAKMYPDFLIPGVRRTRDKLVAEIKRWKAEVGHLAKVIPEDVQWEENFGSKVVRVRCMLVDKSLDEDDAEGHATVHLSFFWGLEANAIPTAFWAIAHALFNPEIYKKVKGEVAKCMLPPVEGSSLPIFDLEMLKENPYLNGVWQESLRLGVSALSPRMVIEDTEINGYMYKKGGMVQGLGQVPQVEEAYWGKDVMEFKPERWLPYPGEDPVTAGRRIRDMGAKVRPFGGGTTMCPGRYYATQEILATVASLVTSFEWDLQGQPMPEPNRDKFGGGGLPPKADVKIRVRRAF